MSAFDPLRTLGGRLRYRAIAVLQGYSGRGMMKLWLFFAGLLCTAFASAEPMRVELKPSGVASPGGPAIPLRSVGRVGTTKDGAGAVSYLHQWPGVYFEATFTGDRFSLGFDDPLNEYRLLVDDQAPVPLKPRGRAWYSVTGLGRQPHVVRLEKVTESVDYRGAFLGFFVSENGVAGTPPMRTRQIEFIGDSSMTGYANRSTTRQCTKDEVRETTDTQQAYPALVAKAAGADYQVNAISGRGLVRNYDGTLPGQALPDVYRRLFFAGAETYDFRGWNPQIVVIKLNADFFPSLRPGERWSSLDDLSAAYIARFKSFVAELRERSPSATFLIWWPDPALIPERALAQMARKGREEIAAAAAAAGVRRLDFLVPPNLSYESSACDYHMSLADHRKMAEWLSGYLRQHPEYWNGR